MKRDEHRVLTEARAETHRQLCRAPPRLQDDVAAVGHAELFGRRRMDFREGLGSERLQLRDAPCLRSRLVVCEHAPGREDQREVPVGNLRRSMVIDGVKARAAARRRKLLDEEPRRAGVRGVGTRPEDAVFLADALVGDAVVIGRAAGSGAAQLVEDIAGAARREQRAMAQRIGNRHDRFEVGADVAGRGQRARSQDDAPLEIRHRAVFFRPLRGRQHDVGQGRGLRQKEVRHHQEVERLEPVLDPPGVGRGDRDVRTEHEQRPHAAVRAHRRQHFVGRFAGTGQVFFRDAPDAGHVTPRGGIVDPAIAGQLVGLLPVLTTALPVALPGDAAVATAGAADLSQRQREIDEGEGVVDAARLLFRPPAGEDHRRGRLAEDVRGGDQIVLGHSRHLRDACRIVGMHQRTDVFESFGACRDVALVDQAVADADVEEAVGERRIGAGAQLQVDRRPFGGRGRTRIRDNELPAVGPLRCEVLHQRRHRLAGIAAGEQHRACARDVLERERQPAVEPEGADRRRRAGGHAEPAVVVDVRGLQTRRGRTCRGGRPFRWSARRCRRHRLHRGHAQPGLRQPGGR